MYGKTAIYIFFAVIIALFIYYYTTLPQTPSSASNPIDPNNEYTDYLKSENANTVTYTLIGQIEEINEKELILRTFNRTVAIEKPAETKYVSLTSRTPIDESQLQKNEFVRATVNMDKSADEIASLFVEIVDIKIYTSPKAR